jgi:hypothetical protein
LNDWCVEKTSDIITGQRLNSHRGAVAVPAAVAYVSQRIWVLTIVLSGDELVK